MNEKPIIITTISDDHLEVDCPFCGDGIDDACVTFLEAEAECGLGDNSLPVTYLYFEDTECPCFGCGKTVIVRCDEDEQINEAWDRLPERDRRNAYTVGSARWL